jgi:ActR/RegA family two-component response regulator
VLLVEDEEPMQRYLSRLFQSEGLEVSVVAKAAEASEQLARNAHAAAIIDERLPGGSGLEVLRAARLAGNAVPAIVLTGYGSVAAVTEAVSLGLIDYQCKPAVSDRLRASLRIALRVGACRPTTERSIVAPHAGVSLPLLALYLNLEHADNDWLRTHLAWAADSPITFIELISTVRALATWSLRRPNPDTLRHYVRRHVRFAVEAQAAVLTPEVTRFIDLVPRRDRFCGLTDEAVAELVGVPFPRLSQLVQTQLDVSKGLPDRGRDAAGPAAVGSLA